MHPEYLSVRFRTEERDVNWPETFAVITAYATTGQTWTAEENEAADRELREHLSSLSSFVRRITGYSPSTGHAEPGWAVEIAFEEACDIGRQFKQDAIYFISSDRLYLSHCDFRRGLKEIGCFSSRLNCPKEGY